jgi:NAD-dependent dihydropyrimidine dehydrogenase PreA subunit
MTTNSVWFPTVYSDKCDRCDGAYKCVDFCPHNVLAIQDEQVYVINPLGCITGCSTCASLCPKNAITFPSRAETSRVQMKRSLLHRVSCQGCGKCFSTDRDTKYCFDCESSYHSKSMISGKRN